MSHFSIDAHFSESNLLSNFLIEWGPFPPTCSHQKNSVWARDIFSNRLPKLPALTAIIKDRLHVRFTSAFCIVFSWSINVLWPLKTYCELTISQEQHFLKCIYSMMPIIQINFVLYKMEARKDGVGRERERAREKERNRSREWGMEHRR
jgi:hypothetical protein